MILSTTVNDGEGGDIVDVVKVTKKTVGSKRDECVKVEITPLNIRDFPIDRYTFSKTVKHLPKLNFNRSSFSERIENGGTVNFIDSTTAREYLEKLKIYVPPPSDQVFVRVGRPQRIPM